MCSSSVSLRKNLHSGNSIPLNTCSIHFLCTFAIRNLLLFMEKHFQLRGIVDEIPETRDQMLSFIRESCHNAPAKDYNLLVAVQEALANADVHGCKNDPSQIVHCSVECNDSAIAITVRDPGPGFDLASLPDPTSTENVAEEHGRGIFLLRSLMDEVCFEEGGRLLQMRKLRRPA
jgi:serine/threonine-protein kinase RsbW